MEKPKPLTGPTGPMISVPGQTQPKRAVMPVTGPKKWDAKPRIFRRGMIPEAIDMPPKRTKARVDLIYNVLKGIIFFGRRDKAKQAAALREIKEINPELYDRIKTYYDRLTEEEISFFIGPRPAFHDDGKLAIYDHNRDNPVLQTILKEEKPEDVNIRTLAPKS